MQQDRQSLLEMIDRPAFTVCDGIITNCNQTAKNRLISPGKPIAEFVPEGCEAYKNYTGGILYLTLQIGWIRCGATVVRQEGQDIFLMDRDADQAQLQAMSLAAQQLRIPLSNVMTLADCLFPELKDDKQKEQAAQMRKALFQLLRLISNMADAERYTGLNEPAYENTELCSFLREIFEKASASFKLITFKTSGITPRPACFAALSAICCQRSIFFFAFLSSSLTTHLFVATGITL